VSFERRLTVAAAAAVAVAVLLAALASYFIVRHEIQASVDHSLRSSLTATRGYLGRTHGPLGSLPSRRVRMATMLNAAPNRFGEPGVLEMIAANGTVQRARGVTRSEALPAAAELVALARAGRGSAEFTTRRDGTDLRVLAAGVGSGEAIVLARSLAEQNSTLFHLRLILLVVAAIGIALAAFLGWAVARTTLAPVRRLTAAAEHVAATNDLASRIEESRTDELGSLARSFNAMLAALGESARMQRQLIADASHELRTPVTSLRTNIEYMQQAPDLPAPERERLINDLVGQLEGLSGLVSDLIELAREDERAAPEPLEEVRFDLIVDEAVERARLYAPAARFELSLEPTLVSAIPSRLGRAVSNLLENAVKHAGTDRPIEVRLADGELTIRDHGPGIDPEELPHIFDRFFRGSRSRALPGSGLGLAIVRQVVERHAGSVSASAAPDGGTVVRMRMPVLS
jgi:two-component system sensor histidine kinase MprB